MFFIFRASDRVHLYTAHTTEALITETAAALQNEGGVEADFITVEVTKPVPPGTVPTLTSGNKVVFIPNPRRAGKLASQSRIEGILGIPRSNWTTAHIRELLEILATSKVR